MSPYWKKGAESCLRLYKGQSVLGQSKEIRVGDTQQTFRMFLVALLLATACSGREEEEEELPGGGKGKAVVHLPGHLHDQLPDHLPDHLPPTSTPPFLPSSSLSNSSAPPRYQAPPLPFTIPSIISAPATHSEKGWPGIFYMDVCFLLDILRCCHSLQSLKIPFHWIPQQILNCLNSQKSIREGVKKNPFFSGLCPK